MALGLADLERSRCGHIDYRFRLNGRHDSYGEIDVYNGHKCYKWCTDG